MGCLLCIYDSLDQSSSIYFLAYLSLHAYFHFVFNWKKKKRENKWQLLYINNSMGEVGEQIKLWSTPLSIL